MMHSAKAMQIVFRSLGKKTIASTAFKTIERNSSVTTWNKDWKPGPYPRTQEERIAAAKKYNLIPEDYEPYPEEEGYGDYPKFKLHHAESRNAFEPYDFSYLKRNYGEPLHPEFDISLEDKTNFQQKFRTPFWKQLLYVSCGVSLYVTLLLYFEYNSGEFPMIPKQLPLSGQAHYTFEPED